VNLSLSARSGQDDEDEESEELEGDDDNFGTDEDQHENKVGNDALFSTEAGLVNESAKHRVPSELQGFFEMSMQPARHECGLCCLPRVSIQFQFNNH